MEKIKYTRASSMNKCAYTLFWNGPFSQWYPSKFKVDNKTYNCCEQYMMAQKALLFNDDKAYQAIMKATDPKEQKALGRKVKGFNADKWAAVAKNIVYRGNYAKFSGDLMLKEILLNTAGTELVEASPYDTIWGIGLAEDDPKALDKSQWRGLNWLGEVLTKVREDFMKEEDNNE
jgi:ribA/ribD-fused uncharacterized protein